MKLLIMILILSPAPLFAKKKASVVSKKIEAVEYRCDEKKELTPKLIALKEAHNSEEFRKVYTGLYSELELSVRRICEYLKSCEFASKPEDDKEIRANFLATASGKKLLAKLEQARKLFGYNTADAYLFDDHELNDLGNAIATDLIKNGDHTIYLNDKNVVAYLDQVGEEAVLTRLNSKCEPTELVSFQSLTNFENPVHIKVTKKYCSSSQNKGPTFKNTNEILHEMGAYMQNPGVVEEQMEAEELCGPWLPKTEPIGMVIDASEPSAKAMTAKGKKSSKKSSTSRAKTSKASAKNGTVSTKVASAKKSSRLKKKSRISTDTP